MWMNPSLFPMASLVSLGTVAFAEGCIDAGEKVFRKQNANQRRQIDGKCAGNCIT